jgi:SAM-dependent methyltransferase
VTKPWVRISLISFLILFLELLVIRLVSTEIRIFAYLANLVLLATFVGSGLGMLTRKKLPLSITAVGLTLLTLVLVTQTIVRLPTLEFRLFSGITELLAPLSEAYIWFQVDTVSRLGIIIGILLTVVIFGLIMAVFMPLGQFLGLTLNQARQPLLAYSVNIAASLAGMWAFYLWSNLGLSPFLGLVTVQVLLIALITDRIVRLYTVAALLASLVLLAPRSAHQPLEKPVTFWSPYQKLTLSAIQDKNPHRAQGWYLEVNNVGYMGLLDLSAYAVEQRLPAIKAWLKDKQRLADLPFINQYDLPYQFKPEAKEVLIIGGGAGNDAAAAVRAKIPAVDLVEIDPQIVAISRKYHVESPYDKPNVQVYVNDGRAFLETTRRTYDVVVMGLADSHALSSSLTNVQLDNYLYTLEALRQVKAVLKPDGILVLSFEVTRPWIGARLQQTITQAFGYPPAIFEVRSDGAFGWGGIMFVNGKDTQTVAKILQSQPALTGFITRHAKSYAPAAITNLTDNWPYIYLDQPRLPLLHLVMAGIIITSLWWLKGRLLSAKNGMDWPFFWLGAGFMVYEFQNISKSSLIFGNTWMTNLFIITGVLSLILAANLIVARKWIGLKWAIGLLLASLGAQLLVPTAWFNSLSGLTKAVAAIGWLNLPHFFSGIVFAHLFAGHKNKAIALGSNFLGSASGGFLEILSFLWGMQSLVYVAILLYALGVRRYLIKR